MPPVVKGRTFVTMPYWDIGLGIWNTDRSSLLPNQNCFSTTATEKIMIRGKYTHSKQKMCLLFEPDQLETYGIYSYRSDMTRLKRNGDKNSSLNVFYISLQALFQIMEYALKHVFYRFSSKTSNKTFCIYFCACFITRYTVGRGARRSVVVKALCYKPEGRGIASR
jgi:hypothetical protein